MTRFTWLTSLALLLAVLFTAVQGATQTLPLNPQKVLLGLAAKRLAPFMKESSTVDLDWGSTYHTVLDPPGGPFVPRNASNAILAQLGSVSPDNVGLPPGDYRVRLLAFCTRGGGVQRIDTSAHPTWHEQFLVGPLRGQRAELLRAFYARGAVKRIPYSSAQSLSWAITGGLKYEQLSPDRRALFDRLVPEYRGAMAYDQLDAIGSRWESVRTTIPSLPPFESAIDQLGGLGKTIRELQAVRQTTISTANNFDAQMRQLAPIVQAPADAVVAAEAWSVVSDHEYARVLVPSNYHGIGSTFALEIRLLPKANETAAGPATAVAAPVKVQSPFLLFYPPYTGAQPISAQVAPDDGSNAPPQRTAPSPIRAPSPPPTPSPMPAPSPSPSTTPTPRAHCVRFAAEIVAAASATGVDAMLLAAVAAQETGGAGGDDGRNIVGDFGHGHGVFQIDDRFHDFARRPEAMDPARNAMYAANLLRSNLKRYHGDVHAALSAYNSGSPTRPGSTATWPDKQVLPYADSVLRHLSQLNAHNAQTNCSGGP